MRYKEIIHNALSTANLKTELRGKIFIKDFWRKPTACWAKGSHILAPQWNRCRARPFPSPQGLMRGSTCVAFSLGVTAAWTNLDWSMWTGWWPRWQSQGRGPGECMQDKEHSHTPCVFREPVWGRGRCTLGSHLDGSLGREWSVKRPRQREAETSPNFQQPK